MVRRFGRGFINDRQRKAVMSKFKSSKITQHMHLNDVNQVRIIKKPVTKSLNNQIIPSQMIPKCAGRQIMPIFLSSIIGVPIPNSVSNAAFDSIVDSYEDYKEKKNIDDALYVGVESFVNNYTRNYASDYLQSHIQKRTDDEIFKDVLLGTILLSSSIIEL